MQKVLRGTPEYYKLVSVDHGQPLYLMINLLTSCSYRCIKCAFESGCEVKKAIRTPLPVEEWRRIIGVAAQTGVKAIVIAGLGEPTENFGLLSQIISIAAGNNLDTVLFTTLAGLSEEQIKFFMDNRTTLITSLDSIKPEMYRWLTGGGDLPRVFANLESIRMAFPVEEIPDGRITRLGINTTVVRQSSELTNIRALAGEEFLFVANAPMHRGRFAKGGAWAQLVGSTSEDFERLTQAAQAASETGSHASVTEGLCGWFSRGVSIDYDGRLISCGYATETRGDCFSTELKTATDFLARYKEVRSRFSQFTEAIGRKPSCPLRDKDYPLFVKLL